MALNTISKTLFVGNLHASLEENDLLNVFKPYGNIVECCKKWCHYGFIQFSSEEEAKLAYTNLNGSKLRGRHMRIEFQKKKIKNLPSLDENQFRSSLFHSENLIEMLDENYGSCDDLLRLILASNSMDSESCFKKNEPENTNNVLRSLVFNTNDLSKHKPRPFSNLSNSPLKPAKPEPKFYLDPLESIANELMLVDKENQDSEASTFESLCNFLDYNLNEAKKSSDSAGSCSKMKLFKSINSSNTIFIQPHDVLAPLSEAEFREYKLFPIVQN